MPITTRSNIIATAVVMRVQVTVVLKHMFAPADLVEEPTLKDDLEADILAECTKLGPVDKVHTPLCKHYLPLDSFSICMHLGS